MPKKSAGEPLLDMIVEQTAKDAGSDAHYLGHRERLREKMMMFGGKVLQDYELMEMILMHAIPRRDVKPLAKELIKTFGSFSAVLNAPPEEVMKISGIKKNTAILFLIIREAAVRMLKNEVSIAPVINNWDSLIAYCRIDMAQKKTEELRVLYLDVKGRLIKDEVSQNGTVNQTAVYPREIVKRALELCAVSVVMVHNHPAGDLRPSKNDIAITKMVVDALKTVNITLIDHIIVSKTGYTSFKSCGYL